MPQDDPYRSHDTGPERGAYTPPTEDDLPFDSQPYQKRGPTPTNEGGFSASGRSSPPVALIIAGLVLLGLLIAVFVYYRAGPRASNDAPATIGTPVEQMKIDPPVDAQPIDSDADIGVHEGTSTPTTEPTFTSPPEAVQPRPEPRPEPAPTPAAPRPEPRPAPRAETPPPVATPTPPAKKAPAPTPPAQPAPAAGGNSSVQIGAFSTPGQAENEYASVVGRYPQFTRGANRRVQEVTAANGNTVYRTTVTGLSRDQADRLCSSIRGSGGDCFVR